MVSVENIYQMRKGIPYIMVNEKSGTQSVEFREAVLGLEVTPHISLDKQILLDLIVSQNAPGSRVAYGLGEVVSIDKQEINTQVLAKEGETIVLRRSTALRKKAATAMPSPVKIYLRQDARRFAYISESREEIM